MSNRRCTVEDWCTPYRVIDGRADPPMVTMFCKHCGREFEFVIHQATAYGFTCAGTDRIAQSIIYGVDKTHLRELLSIAGHADDLDEDGGS